VAVPLVGLNMSELQFKTQNSKSKTLFISAGDLSGDIHAARVVRRILERHPDWQIFALGGSHLKAAGARIVGDTRHLGVIGFASAMAVLPRSLRLRRKADRFLQGHKVDAALLCDWGGFNSRLLPELNRRNIPSLYYFPPRSWQKTGEGGLAIASLATRIATPFDWSAQRLKNAGANVEWVGHPLLEIVDERAAQVSRQAIREEIGVTGGQLLIAVLPGSRDSELKLLAPHLAGAMRLLNKNYPGQLRFVVAVPEGAAKRVRPHFPDTPIYEGRTTQILLASNGAMVKSGTVTLETAVCNIPQIVVYDVSPIVHAQIRLTGLHKKVPFVAMPNIILGRGAVPELLGIKCRPAPIAEAMSVFIESSEARVAMQQEYCRVREALGAELPYTATNRTVEMLEEMLGVQPASP
jgi:lipid-A-disaccharide synthase